MTHFEERKLPYHEGFFFGGVISSYLYSDARCLLRPIADRAAFDARADHISREHYFGCAFLSRRPTDSNGSRRTPEVSKPGDQSHLGITNQFSPVTPAYELAEGRGVSPGVA